MRSLVDVDVDVDFFLMGVGITAMVAVVGCDDGRLNYLRGSLRV